MVKGTATVKFSNGAKLGLLTEARRGIVVTFVAKDSFAYREGIQIGDVVKSVNGKAAGSNNDEFCRTIRSLQQKHCPIQLGLVGADVDDGMLKIHEKAILLEAGQAYKRDVHLDKGESLRLQFWLLESDLDINFSVHEGHHQVVCRRGQRKMSWSFTARQAGKFTLSWDNGHSWVRSKHLNYYLEVLPEEAQAAATKRLETEAGQIRKALAAVDANIASMELALATERANRGEVMQNLVDVETKLGKAKASAGGAKQKAVSSNQQASKGRLNSSKAVPKISPANNENVDINV